MRPAVFFALAFVLQCSPSVSFVASSNARPSSAMLRDCRNYFKRRRSERSSGSGSDNSNSNSMFSQHQASQGSGEWEGGSLLELDVVEYRMLGKSTGPGTQDKMELASYIGDGKLHPLLTRTESGPRLFFYDEDAQSVSVSGDTCRIERVIDQVYYSQRIVEDRVKNPHGEEAEDCFLIEEALNPAVVIRVEHSDD